MTTWQRNTVLAVVLLVASSGFSPGDADGSPTPSDESMTGEVGTVTDMDPSFDVRSLPDGFPSELIPDSFTAGMYAELGSIRNVNFESPSSFDDVVGAYTDKIGEEPIIAQGEERLAQWTVDIWAVSVVESTPT
ncbi:MAG: hypothetical protein ABFR53_08590, partial [Actinomycetota bacterium]